MDNPGSDKKDLDCRVLPEREDLNERSEGEKGDLGSQVRERFKREIQAIKNIIFPTL